MGMRTDETLDWLYRLRSEIYVYMPREWLVPMNNALDFAIRLIENYDERLKSDMVAMLTDIQLEIEETVAEEKKHDERWALGLKYSSKIIQAKINALKETI